MSAATLRQRAAPVKEHDDVLASSDSESEAPSKDTRRALEDSYPPFDIPQFSIKELLDVIPKHCFHRSLWRSSVSLAQDIVLYSLLWYAASHIDSRFNYQDGTVLKGWAGFAAKWALWATYWIWQGFVSTGLWVQGHECGHQAFSESKAINNGVGMVIHSLLLVPYHPWRISHGRHHAATGHKTRDEVFVPRTASQVGVTAKGTGKKTEVSTGVWLDELLEDAPAYRFFFLVMQQLVGWPMYLIRNASGQKHYPKYTNHFDPNSIIFDKRHRQQVLISDAALVAVFALYTYVAQQLGGFGQFVKFFGIPYLMTNNWLVAITYLQHTDPALPHYGAEQWNFQRGALCTMDRKMFGWVGPHLLHGICETHVAHHLISKVPHYHAWDATEALKAKLGHHYHSSDEPFLKSLWESYKKCRYVDDEGDVLFFRDAYGRQYRKVAKQDVPSDSGVDVADVE